MIKTIKLFVLLLILPFIFSFTPPKYKVAKHTAYTTYYDVEHNQALYVVYGLGKNYVKCSKHYDRQPNFKPDTAVNSIKDKVYENTGYDRGHMMSAEDASCNQQAEIESFYTSNICPQAPQLNRGQWKSLEIAIRKVAERKDTITVITGPIPQWTLVGKLYIPKAFFKIVLDHKVSTYKAWIMPNNDIDLYEKYEIKDTIFLPDYIQPYISKYKLFNNNIKNF